jgi:16S rRNA (guanine1207-N2)-methyltransferase
MKAGAADTLFMPVERGDLAVPEGPVAFLNAHIPSNGFPDALAVRLICEQAWRGTYLDLVAARLEVRPRIEMSDCAGAFVLCGKHRRENEAMIARAARICREGAPIVVAGDKQSGTKPLRKRMSVHGTLSGQADKNHAHVFWFPNPGSDGLPLEAALSPLPGISAEPGMFSADHADPGSVLLARSTKKDWSGAVADLGCGWGYLSLEAAETAAVTSIDLIEAHFPSLEAAKANLERSDLGKPVQAHWLDLERETMTGRFDTIICNPPFHAGSATMRSLGERFIQVGARALRSGGMFYMVANTGLAYEPVINAAFRSHEEVVRENGFKILRAVAR